jgi:hypothetical protein
VGHTNAPFLELHIGDPILVRVGFSVARAVLLLLLVLLLLAALVAVLLVELAPDYAQMERTSVVPDADYVRMDPMWAAPGVS